MPIEFLIFISIFLFVAAVLDMRYLKVPNKLIFLGLICYIILAFIIVRLNKISSFGLFQSVVTSVIMTFIIFVMPYILGKICHKPFLGAGDVKLAFLIGACLDVGEFLVFTAFLVLYATVLYLIKYRFNKNEFRLANAFVPVMFLGVLSTLVLKILEVI